MKHLFLSFFSLAVLTSCGMDEFPKYSALDRLRILALVVDTPEIQNPSAGIINVQMTPYLSDLNGTGTVALEIQSCLDSGVAYGAEPSCVGAVTASSLLSQTVTFADLERTGAPTGAITVPLTIPAGLLAGFSPTLQFNGVPYLITVKATRGSEIVRSFRRVLLSTKTPNQNPTLGDLLVNGSSLTVLPTGEVALSFSATGTPETYQFLSSTGTVSNQTEVFETTWFISEGVIENPRTRQGETITWKAPASGPSGRQAVVVGVLRDGRGGVSVLIRKL
jgi:hypothetical protein